MRSKLEGACRRLKTTGNPIFFLMISPLMVLLKESRVMTIKDRDPYRAYQAMRDHLALAEQDLKEP